METTNPYAAPKAPVADLPKANQDEPVRLERIAAGQRLIIYALLAQFAAYALTVALGNVGVVVTLIAVLFSIVGMIKLAGALGSSVLSRILLTVGMFIPLVSLLILASLSAKATRRLRAAGYKVGLLGARRSA